ncbi:sialidase-like isoform X2 [Cygnus olor]|uniref:sialidase-like isoform X2 n=1 Tax=Cygnus olor TaxID=8869 RepID=UPI001ADE0E4F|nr:sialidase-like isoform X2 [Cygnus olor]
MEQQNKDHSQPAEGQQRVQERRQFLLQMEKLQDMKTLPHSGVRQEERIHLPAMPPFPRQAATQAAAPKQARAAQTSSSERVTCKLPRLQATASASSAAGRAKALGTEAHSHQELLPPLPCISGERDKAVRAGSRERGPHSPVAPDEDMEYTVRSFVSTVIRNALACNEEANSKARLSPSGRGPGTKGYRTPPLTTAVPQNGKKKSQHSSKSSPAAPAEEIEDPLKAFVSAAINSAIARNQGAMREARLSPLGRRPRSKGRITPPLLTAVPQNWKKSQHPAKNSPAASAEDMEDPVKAFVSSVISSAIACNEGATREAELPPLCRGPRSKGHRTPPLLTAVPQDWKKSRQAAPHCPTDSFAALRDTAQSLVSEVLAKTMAESWEHGQRPAELVDLAHTGCTVTSTRAVEVQTDTDSRWTTALPGRHHQARSGKPAAGRDPAPASPDRGEKQGQQRQIHIKPRQGSGKDGTSQGRGRKERGPERWDEEEEIIIFNSWINPSFPSLFQEPQAFPQKVCSSPSSVDREAAAQEAEPPTRVSLGSPDTETSPACLEERHGTPLTATAPAESRPASPPSAPAFEDERYRAPPQTRGEEIVIFNSWINPRFPSLLQEPQAFPQEEGSSSSSVDTEAAAEAAEPPTSASLGSLEPTDTAPSAAPLAEGPGEERHGTPLTATAPAESRPASPPSAPAFEDEGKRAPPLIRGAPESKPSACPTPSEHSTAVMAESQGRAQLASSACDEDLYETARIIVSAVLRHAVAMSQGATSKAPTAPSATGPRVPPPTAEPVDCTSSASALAGGAVGEATEAPLTAAAAPQEEVASPMTADLLREDITDLSPAAADEAGAAATPLAMVPGHQVAAEQGGQAQSSSCTRDTPADEPATSQTQAPSQGLLAGPVQRNEQHQGLGILDLAQAPARQPRPSRVRRALRALRRAFCCSCIAGQRE